MKNNIICGALLISVFIAVPVSRAEENRVVKQEELARELADKLDLSVSADAQNPGEDFKNLAGTGIAPASGWEEGKAVTRQDLKDVLSQAARIGKDEKLENRGITLPQGQGEYVDKDMLKKVFDDQATKNALTARGASLSGPSLPYPKDDYEKGEKADLKQRSIIDMVPQGSTPNIMPVTTPAPMTQPGTYPPPTTEPTTQPTTEPTTQPTTEPTTQPLTTRPPISDR